MTEYITSFLNDDSFSLVVITFSGLYLSVYLIGFFIRLLISLLNKITLRA